MIRRGGSILAIVYMLVVTSACGSSLTPTPPSPTPGPTATEIAVQTPAALEWSIGDPADAPTLLDPLPDRLVGDVGPLGNAVYRGGEVRRGARGRPGLILGHLDGTHRILVDLGRSPRWDAG